MAPKHENKMVFYLLYRIMFYHSISKCIKNQSTENPMTQQDKVSSVWAQYSIQYITFLSGAPELIKTFIHAQFCIQICVYDL